MKILVFLSLACVLLILGNTFIKFGTIHAVQYIPGIFAVLFHIFALSMKK